MELDIWSLKLIALAIIMQATTVVSMPLERIGVNISYRTLAAMGAFFSAYLLVAELGALLQYPTPIPIFWPPAGIALAAIVLFGSSMWPAIALGAFLFCLISGMPLSLAIIITTAVVLSPLVGAYALRRLNFDPLLARVSDTVSLFVVAAVTGLIVPVTVASALVVAQLSPVKDFFVILGPLWLGHTLSMSVLAPFIIRWMRRPYRRTRMELFENVAAMAALIAVDILVFLTPYSNYQGIPLVYLILLPLLWISLRVGPRPMTLALLITSIIALAGVSSGASALSPAMLLGVYLNTEIFLLALAVLFLIFVSSEEGRKDALIAIRGYVEKLEKALSRIRSEDRTKSEFIAILAHELRNPLAAIRTSVEVIGMEMGGDKRIQPLVGAIDERVQTTVRLLDDLLDISRISRRKLELRKEVVDVPEVIERSIQSVQPGMASRAHTLRTEFSGVCRAVADPMRLEQIFVNLFTNAIKYTSAGGIITVACARKRDRIVISVHDTGVGIPQHMQEKIFEPFVQISQSVYGNSGLGIGLSLTKQLVGLHNGTIEVMSEGENRGSTFTVSLPAAPEGAEQGLGARVMQGIFRKQNPPANTADPPAVLAGGQEEKETVTDATADAGRSILVVDDNHLAAQGLCKLLRMRGYRAEPAYTGERAIMRVREWAPEAVILDIGLPGMSGYQVASSLRKDLGYRGAIIALTGYGQERDRHKATESGFDRHLVKPVGLAEIEAVLNEVLQPHEQHVRHVQ